MSEKPKKNRLFAMLYSTENVDYAARFRFSRVTPDYILLYTDKARIKPPTGKAAEIKEDDLSELTAMDESWLFDCGITLLAERTAAHQEDGLKRFSDMVDRLEEELKAQKRGEGDET